MSARPLTISASGHSGHSGRVGIALSVMVLATLHCRCPAPSGGGGRQAPRGDALVVQPDSLRDVRQGGRALRGSGATGSLPARALAAEDPLAFLRMCRRHYDATIRDYRSTFLIRERLDGKLGPEQEINIMFRESPFSVDMRWVRNPGLAKHANYVAGRWRDEKGRELALFRPSGLLGLLPIAVRRDIHGALARRQSRRPLDQFGFKITLDLIIAYCETAKGGQGYDLRFVGEGKVDGRPTFTFNRILPYAGVQGQYPDGLLVIHIDREWLLPTACIAYTDSGAEHLMGSYIQTKVEFNLGLTDEDFDPAAGGRRREQTPQVPDRAETIPKRARVSTQIRFERVPPSSLPRFVHFNGQPRASLLPEDNGSGCAWGDYDGDGDDDLYLCNMSGPYLMPTHERRRLPGSRLWRNDGGGRFTDVTESCGLGASRMDMAALFADFDNDSDADLLVTGLEGVRLYRNDAGRYRDVTESLGLGGVEGYCLGAAWGDYDRDGRLDLYICRYVDFPLDKARTRPLVAGRPAPMTTPADYPPAPNHLFHQQADGAFRDVSAVSGTAAGHGRSMQAIWCDFDNDGWIDLYVANDQSLDCLFRNRGDGTFEDVALPSGLFDPRGGMGVAVIDFQADGDQDLLVTHWVSEDPAFYVNDVIGRQCVFEDRAVQYGLRKEDLALVGWGVEFEDFDNDADGDLFIVHGSTIEDELTLEVLKHPKMLPQRCQIYEWRKKRWHALGDAAGTYFREAYVGRGAAVADFDGDGRPDMAINNHGAAPALLHNVSRGLNHWLAVKLVGRHCNRDAANARVTVFRQGSPPQMRELFIGSGYLSGRSKTLHFGCGPRTRTVKVEVRWPCGRVQRLGNVALDRTIVITEEQDKTP